MQMKLQRDFFVLSLFAFLAVKLAAQTFKDQFYLFVEWCDVVDV